MPSNAQLHPEQDNDREQIADKLIEFLDRAGADRLTQLSDEELHESMAELSQEDFHALTQRVNGIVRGLPKEERGYAEGFVAIGEDDMRTRPEDRKVLMEYLLCESVKAQSREGTARTLASGIGAIHPFADGNGRTSRVVYELLREQRNLESASDDLAQAVTVGDSRVHRRINGNHVEQVREKMDAYVEKCAGSAERFPWPSWFSQKGPISEIQFAEENAGLKEYYVSLDCLNLLEQLNVAVKDYQTCLYAYRMYMGTSFTGPDEVVQVAEWCNRWDSSHSDAGQPSLEEWINEFLLYQPEQLKKFLDIYWEIVSWGICEQIRVVREQADDDFLGEKEFLS